MSAASVRCPECGCPVGYIHSTNCSKYPEVHKRSAATRRRNHGAFGSRRERQVAELLRADGWVVFRSSGSFGVCDLVALRASPLGIAEHEARMIEVKGTARSPWVAWGPAERQALLESASRAGATPVLAWWPPGRELTWYSESEWP